MLYMNAILNVAYECSGRRYRLEKKRVERSLMEVFSRASERCVRMGKLRTEPWKVVRIDGQQKAGMSRSSSKGKVGRRVF